MPQDHNTRHSLLETAMPQDHNTRHSLLETATRSHKITTPDTLLETAMPQDHNTRHSPRDSNATRSQHQTLSPRDSNATRSQHQTLSPRDSNPTRSQHQTLSYTIAHCVAVCISYGSVCWTTKMYKVYESALISTTRGKFYFRCLSKKFKN